MDQISKEVGVINVEDRGTTGIPEKYRGTTTDQGDMEVLGIKQVLRRNFQLSTMLCFSSVAVLSWEFLPLLSVFALIDGGPAAIFWGLVAGTVGYSMLYMSVAEVASMCPTAGGQYHWVSELAPPNIQKLLSYSVGWLIAIGWQVYLAGSSLCVGLVTQGLIALNYPDYNFQRWHCTLLAIAAVCFAVVFNTVLAKHLPNLQYVVFALHVFGLFAIVIPIWITADHGSARESLLTFQDNGNWGHVGLSTLIGMAIFAGCLNGFDCVAHMSEEIRDASRNVPIAIIWTVSYNIAMNFLMVTTLVFCMGDTESLVTSRTGQPFLQLFYNATGSLAGSSVMGAIIVALLEFCIINEVTTSSRQLWSFARDRGLPCSTWISYVAPGWDIPLRAVGITITVTTLLSVINLGSTVALDAINSLGGVALMCSYTVTIGCLVWRRLRGAPLPPRRWSLGRYGLAVNIGSLCFVIPLLFFFCWPLERPVTAANMNWGAVMLCAVLLVALVHYVLKARHEYTGPVVRVKRS